MEGIWIDTKTFANQHGFESESFNYWCKKQYSEIVKADAPIKIPNKPQGALPGFLRTYFRFGHERPKSGG